MTEVRNRSNNKAKAEDESWSRSGDRSQSRRQEPVQVGRSQSGKAKWAEQAEQAGQERKQAEQEAEFSLGDTRATR